VQSFAIVNSCYQTRNSQIKMALGSEVKAN